MMMHQDAAFWLYGSYARGNTNPESDIDLLVVNDSPIPDEKIPTVPEIVQGVPSVSSYRWSEIEGMASYGSLFLHHLRLEGKCISEGPMVTGRLWEILAGLSPYRRACADVSAFRISVSDVLGSLRSTHSVPFELSVVGTVLRHASILGCYVSGEPSFGRVEPVQRVVSLWELPKEISIEFSRIYEYRLWADGRAGYPGPATVETVMHWCSRVGILLDILEDRADDFENRLPQAITAR